MTVIDRYDLVTRRMKGDDGNNGYHNTNQRKISRSSLLLSGVSKVVK